MKKIPLTQGKFALVDDEDYETLMQWKWHIDQGYAKRGECIDKTRGARKYRIVLMHRKIMNTPESMDVDHIDHNKLNNQKANLRNVTKSQNNMNRKSEEGSTSKYKGVFWNRGKGRWTAKIGINKRQKYIGSFSNEIEAAKAYNKVALKLFGSYALINEISEVA